MLSCLDDRSGGTGKHIVFNELDWVTHGCGSGQGAPISRLGRSCIIWRPRAHSILLPILMPPSSVRKLFMEGECPEKTCSRDHRTGHEVSRGDFSAPGTRGPMGILWRGVWSRREWN